MRDPDPLADAFAELRRTELDAALERRVHARACAELAPPRVATTAARLRLALLAALVPALLLSAAAAQFVETVQVAAKIYGRARRG
jgi:hypothetical protein